MQKTNAFDRICQAILNPTNINPNTKVYQELQEQLKKYSYFPIFWTLPNVY